MSQGQVSLASVATAIGWWSHGPLSKIMLTSRRGVAYYAEAHRSRWNAWVHTVGMPVSIYGLLLVAAAIAPSNLRIRTMWMLYYLYGGHYLRMGLFKSIPYYLVYGPVTWQVAKAVLSMSREYNASEELREEYGSLRAYILYEGLGYSTGGLLVQEALGHRLGGDMPSRPEAVPNAILYALYFSVMHNH